MQCGQCGAQAMEGILSMRFLIVLWGASLPQAGAAPPSLHDDARRASFPPPITLQILSSRADMVTGGDVLVRVPVPAPLSSADLGIRLDERDITAQFTVTRDGQLIARLAGLASGPPPYPYGCTAPRPAL